MLSVGLQPREFSELKLHLDNIVNKVNNLDFITLDPISVPHRYTLKQDIEISGFFSAIFAWGNRKTIISKALELMSLMDDDPFKFIINHQETDLKSLLTFRHRTFQATDLIYFIHFLKEFYLTNESLEAAFMPIDKKIYSQKEALIHFHHLIFNDHHAPDRSKKHIATPARNSTCKRLNMFLRWMVRSDDRKVDFGIWKRIPMSDLMIPMDVHVEKYAREFGLLTRKQRDWMAVEEITNNLKKMNPSDPIIYDYALFGLGIGHYLDS